MTNHDAICEMASLQLSRLRGLGSFNPHHSHSSIKPLANESVGYALSASALRSSSKTCSCSARGRWTNQGPHAMIAVQAVKRAAGSEVANAMPQTASAFWRISSDIVR